MSVRIIQGDCRVTLADVPDCSVHMAVTSPPYWALRSYLKADSPLKSLELGSEPTPEAYIANMLDVFRAVRRVLRDDATLWVNLGDTYASSGGKRTCGSSDGGTGRADAPGPRIGCLPSGNRVGIPERFALAMQADGWWWRDTVIWCLSPSTVVYAKTATTVGPMTIHDLVRLDPTTVTLWTGQAWSQVRGWSESKAECNTVRLTLRSGETISCTDVHQWPLKDGRVARAGDLKIGDVLATCQLPDSDSAASDIPDDLAWFAGLYLAEGHMDDDAIRIAGHTAEWFRHSRVANIAARYGGTSTLHFDGDTASMTVHGRIIIGAIQHFVTGLNASGKHLHPRCWSLPNRTLSAFLDGYLDGDGSWDQDNGRWRLGFCRNNAWAGDLRVLCARLGYQLTLKPTYSWMGRTKRFESYRGELRKDATVHHNSKHRSEIVKIERGRLGTYYDIGIADEPHLFALASGVLTHNSKPAPMPSSVNGWRWERCRRQVGSAAREHKGHDRLQGGRADNGKDFASKAPTDPCPGCDKCRANDGWVLRRGSWRTTTAHEVIFMFAKSASYFCDAEAVKQNGVRSYDPRTNGPVGSNGLKDGHQQSGTGTGSGDCTANPRSVWTIGPQPLKHKHYAAYPEELPRRCIQAGTPDKGCCPKCGAPWARMVERTFIQTQATNNHSKLSDNADVNWDHATTPRGVIDSRTVGWLPTCDCEAGDPVPCVVLDPFGGSGTTAIVASMMGRNAISCELNPEYVAMHRTRFDETAPLLIDSQSKEHHHV